MPIPAGNRRFKAKPLTQMPKFQSPVIKPLRHLETNSANTLYEQGYLKYLKAILFDFMDIFTVHGFERVIKTSLNSIKG